MFIKKSQLPLREMNISVYQIATTVFEVITELFAYVIMGQKNAAITDPPSTMTYRYLGNTTQNY